MKNFKILTLVFFVLISTNLFSQQSSKKIGVIFNINGPFKIYKQAVYALTGTDKNVDENDKFYGVIQFLGTDKGNPLPQVKDFYLNILKEKRYEPVVLDEVISENNFPKFTEKKNGQDIYKLDIRTLKKKYDIDEVIIVKGQYGLEVEMIGGFGGDKRTNIGFTSYLVDTNTNILKGEFNVYKYQNIHKKDLINPPDYPNVTESMELLLTKKVFPTLKSKILDL